MREQIQQMNSEVHEMNVQVDHVHLTVQIPLKLAISEYMGPLKGKITIRVFGAFRDLRQRRYQENYFGEQGYCVRTVGLDQEMIRKYVRWQEKQ